MAKMIVEIILMNVIVEPQLQTASLGNLQYVFYQFDYFNTLTQNTHSVSSPFSWHNMMFLILHGDEPKCLFLWQLPEKVLHKCLNV